LSDEERVQTLWWEGSFTARERLMRDEPETIAYLSEFVAAEMEARGFERPVQGPSRARLALAHARAFAGSLRARAAAARGRRRGDQASGEFMREFWDARADENALYFVDNTLAYGDVDTARFWAGAERELDALLEPLGARLGRDDDVVEIGCGVGRLTHVIARRAATVRALDVSPRMLDRAREFGRGLGNVEWVLGDGTSLAGIADRSVDACVSHVVFQHIPDPAITLGYVREIGRVLRPGGWAAFQISNDPAIHGRRTGVEGLRIVWRAVRGSGPRGQADPAWLGSYVDLGDLRVAAAECGLEVERVSGEGRQLCFVLVRKIPGR
jgi:SAM-dependent methyltransferase